MAHKTKAERIAASKRKRHTCDNYKGNRSPMPYRRPQHEVDEYIDELNEGWEGDSCQKDDN